MAALQPGDESTYRSLEVVQLDINSQIYAKVFASTSAITPPDTPFPSHETGTTQELTPDTDWSLAKGPEPDWLYDGSSYIVYLKVKEAQFPWVCGQICPLLCWCRRQRLS